MPKLAAAESRGREAILAFAERRQAQDILEQEWDK